MWSAGVPGVAGPVPGQGRQRDHELPLRQEPGDRAPTSQAAQVCEYLYNY